MSGYIDPAGARIFRRKFPGVDLLHLHLVHCLKQPKVIIAFESNTDLLLGLGLAQSRMVPQKPKRIANEAPPQTDKL